MGGWVHVVLLCCASCMLGEVSPCVCVTRVKCMCLGDSYRNVTHMQPLKYLTIADSGISLLNSDVLKTHANSLVDIYLSNVRNLQHIDESSFQGFSQLRTLSIVNAPLLSIISPHLLAHLATLKILKIIRTGVNHVPQLPVSSDTIMDVVDLESNKISALTSDCIRVKAQHLFLGYNNIKMIEGWAFNGSQISKLNLRGNRALTVLAEDAFRGIQDLQQIDLSDTSITHLPTLGLDSIETLILENTYTLKTIPSIYDFKKLQSAKLTYSFHCCAFQFPEKHDPHKHAQYQAWMKKVAEICPLDSPVVKLPHQVVRRDFGDIYEPDEPGTETGMTTEIQGGGEDYMNTPVVPEYRRQVTCGNIYMKKQLVSCTPTPDALNPCEDIMGYVWLRICVWFVIGAAIVGNIAVLSVTLSRTSEKSVPRFLISHLALADLCMAFYLLLLAIKDLQSTEVYFNYAYDWQKGYGCRVAGFVTVFASQLSIFVLGVITLERWYSIKRALYANKLTIRRTMYFILAGYVYATVMAMLPVFGISSYSTTSICLPMDTRGWRAQLYVHTLLLFTAFVFALICICYYQIYSSLDYKTRHSRGECKIARKMALLVLINFACWAPVSFFAFTAALGYPLISVTRSKILLVFFYPINSCFNPYLYALLTKHYRRDLVLTLARIGLCQERARRYRMLSSGLTGNTGLHSLSSSRKQSHDEIKPRS